MRKLTTNTRIYLFLLLLSSSLLAHAQADLGIMIGASTYQGDLAPTNPVQVLTQSQASFGVYGRVGISDRLGFKGFIQSSRVQGSDALRPGSVSRNLSFRTQIFEVGALAEFYPLGNRRALVPYLQGGASVYRFNPEALFNGRYIELQPLGTEGQGVAGYGDRYQLTRLAIPLGFGLRYNLGESFVIGAEISARLLFFDHLDDVSGRYVNYYELVQTNGSLAATLADRTGEYFGTENRDVPTGTLRGDPTNNDWFYTGVITIGYRLGNGLFSSSSKKGVNSRYSRCYKF